MATITDIALDEFGDVVLDEGGDFALASDLDVIVQDLRHRSITVKGSLPEDKDYGFGLQLYVHQEVTPPFVRHMKMNWLLELSKEERILPQRTEISIKGMGTDQWQCTVHFVTKDGIGGSFSLGAADV